MDLSQFNVIQQDPEPSLNPADWLTEAEQKQAVNWEVEQAKRHYIWRLSDAGELPQAAQEKARSRDFLAEINVPEVLQAAARRKKWKIEDEEFRNQQRQELIKWQEQQKAVWGYGKFYKEIEEYYKRVSGKKEFVLNDGNRDFIKAVTFFMAGDIRFETEMGFAFGRGLWVSGTAGLGKTSIFKAVARNPVKPIQIYSMHDISDHVREQGYMDLPGGRLVVLDDVGAEACPVKYYGTEINWFQTFMERYYLKEQPFEKLIITTNLGGDEIEKRYGYRVRSRIREMFNQITVSGQDMRI